ncbi:hypothetical protein PF006_g23706 [Phytophthora fragariae]|nr:hypothetical protein PF006_g23706 [Phytophthora fragariae]
MWATRRGLHSSNTRSQFWSGELLASHRNQTLKFMKSTWVNYPSFFAKSACCTGTGTSDSSVAWGLEKRYA